METIELERDESGMWRRGEDEDRPHLPPAGSESVVSPKIVLPGLTARAKRIRVALARREEQDVVIAQELRAAKDDCGSEPKWLAWCAEEFGWGRAMAFARLSPKQMAKNRARAQATREKSIPYGQPEPEPAPHREIEFHGDPRTLQRKALALEMIDVGFRKLSFERHPDRGGNTEAQALLSDARDWVVNYIEHPPLVNLD